MTPAMPYDHEHPAVQAKLLDLLKALVARKGTEEEAAAVIQRGQSLVSGMLARKKPVSVHSAMRLAEDAGYDLREIYADPVGAKPLWIDADKKVVEKQPQAEVRPLSQSREPKEAELALVEAYARSAARVSARDLLAALDLVRAGELMLPDDRERAVVRGERILAAVSRLRRSGADVTVVGLLGAVLDDDNEEGVRELRALGGEPPREPVRTPPRGLPVVPKPPKPER